MRCTPPEEAEKFPRDRLRKLPERNPHVTTPPVTGKKSFCLINSRDDEEAIGIARVGRVMCRDVFRCELSQVCFLLGDDNSMISANPIMYVFNTTQATTIPGADGFFLISGLPEGDYIVVTGPDSTSGLVSLPTWVPSRSCLRQERNNRLSQILISIKKGNDHHMVFP